MKSFNMPAALLFAAMLPSGLDAAEYKIKSTGKTVKLRPGDSAVYVPSGYKVLFSGFRKHTSECAVPGRNCGSGYFPGTLVLPELKIETDDKCKASPLPAECEFTHKTVNKEKEGYLELSIISVFEPCEKEPDVSNRTSCFIQVIKNGPYNPPFRPQNCERLKDYPEARDTCYETIADKLGDAKICDLVKGNETFQCVYLRAKTAGDPRICRTLKMNRFHHTPQDRLDQIDACLNTVKRK